MFRNAPPSSPLGTYKFSIPNDQKKLEELMRVDVWQKAVWDGLPASTRAVYDVLGQDASKVVTLQVPGTNSPELAGARNSISFIRGNFRLLVAS